DQVVAVGGVVVEPGVPPVVERPADPESEGPVQVLAERLGGAHVLVRRVGAAVVQDDAVSHSKALLVAARILEVAGGVAPLIGAAVCRRNTAARTRGTRLAVP